MTYEQAMEKFEEEFEKAHPSTVEETIENLRPSVPTDDFSFQVQTP